MTALLIGSPLYAQKYKIALIHSYQEGYSGAGIVNKLFVKGQPSYDKQFVRDWLKANPDSDYLLPDEVIEKTVDKYKEAYEVLTGKKFEA